VGPLYFLIGLLPPLRCAPLITAPRYLAERGEEEGGGGERETEREGEGVIDCLPVSNNLLLLVNRCCSWCIAIRWMGSVRASPRKSVSETRTNCESEVCPQPAARRRTCGGRRTCDPSCGSSSPAPATSPFPTSSTALSAVFISSFF